MTQSAMARFEAGGTVPTLPVLGRIARPWMPHLSGRAASACDVTVVACSTARRQFTKRRQIEQFAHAVFPTTYTELLAVTGGEAADVA